MAKNKFFATLVDNDKSNPDQNSETPVSADESPATPVADEFHGQGGSYVVDEVTQTRRLNK